MHSFALWDTSPLFLNRPGHLVTAENASTGMSFGPDYLPRKQLISAGRSLVVAVASLALAPCSFRLPARFINDQIFASQDLVIIEAALNGKTRDPVFFHNSGHCSQTLKAHFAFCISNGYQHFHSDIGSRRWACSTLDQCSIERDVMG